MLPETDVIYDPYAYNEATAFSSFPASFGETQRPFFILGSGISGGHDYRYGVFPKSPLSPGIRYHGQVGLRLYGQTGGEPSNFFPFSSSIKN